MVPSCSSSFSLPGLNSNDQISLNTKNATSRNASSPAADTQPTPGGRSPNCHARATRPPICAQYTAASTNATSCTTVSAISIPGGVCELEIFTPNTAAGASTIKPPTSASASPPISAAGAVHGDQSMSGERLESIVYATQCQVANWATKPIIERAEITSAGVRMRGWAASQAASAMLSGNNTTRNRGSDISGCDATG